MYNRFTRGVMAQALVTLLGVLIICMLPVRHTVIRSSGHAGSPASSPLSLPPASGSAVSTSCFRWRIMPSPNIGPVFNDLMGVAAVASNDVWAVGLGGTSSGLVLHWNGVQWSLSPTPQVNVQLNLLGVTALSGDDVWAVGSVLSGPNDTLTT